MTPHRLVPKSLGTAVLKGLRWVGNTMVQQLSASPAFRPKYWKILPPKGVRFFESSNPGLLTQAVYMQSSAGPPT